MLRRLSAVFALAWRPPGGHAREQHRLRGASRGTGRRHQTR